MSFIDLSPYQDIFIEIGQYITILKYDVQQYLNVHKLFSRKDPQRSSLYHDMVQDIFNEITLASETLKHIVINHNNTLKTVQPNIIVKQQETSHVKWGVITEVFNWLFGSNDNSDTIRQLKSNIEILYNNDKLHSEQIQELFGLNNLP